MIELTMISGMMSALKSAGDITKLIISSHDAAIIREKAIELQTQILSAQQSALTAQSDQFALLQSVSELEGKIADLEAWDTEKQRYELKQLVLGAFAYSLKADMSNSEPPHYICATCYEHGKKSILQLTAQNAATLSLRKPQMYRCSECKAEIIAQ
jgi:DNA-directed RNA polymerase subunit RPC12/RpoP